MNILQIMGRRLSGIFNTSNTENKKVDQEAVRKACTTLRVNEEFLAQSGLKEFIDTLVLAQTPVYPADNPQEELFNAYEWAKLVFDVTKLTSFNQNAKIEALWDYATEAGKVSLAEKRARIVDLVTRHGTPELKALIDQKSKGSQNPEPDNKIG